MLRKIRSIFAPAPEQPDQNVRQLSQRPARSSAAIAGESIDVLVIGAGAAGLRAAIAAHLAGRRVLVVGKRARGDAHTVLAAGGINAVLGTMDPEDTWLAHAADTLREGDWLGDPRAVEILCQRAPAAILELFEWGANFARDENGLLVQRFFGAHRYRRTCFAGDETGREIMRVLVAQVDRLGIPIREHLYVTDLLPGPRAIGGALMVDLTTGEPLIVRARAIVLATGGHTRVYRRSSSRVGENTGDGMALALAAGCDLADMEMVQFHPTGMVWPAEVEGQLVTEAVRGEGGVLRNARGERFMANYDPQRLELSTRDLVALASYREIADGRGTVNGGVYLDISHVDPDHVRERLPEMVRQFARHGIDMTRQAVEVAPTAHYSMGGVRVDPETHATAVRGLYAAGEVTAGVHGANRLGGNSLAECLVFGRIAGESAATHATVTSAETPDATYLRAALARLRQRPGPIEPTSIISELQQTMWQNAGVVRDEAGLNRALADIADLRERAGRLGALGLRDAALATALDVRGLLLTAEATVRSALVRTESRGAHRRRDFPETSADWQRNLVCSLDPDGLSFAPEPIPAPSGALAIALAAGTSGAISHHPLE